MPNVTAPAAPFTARLLVHVITTAAAAGRVAPLCMVTFSTAPTVALLATVFAVPPLVAVHVVAASAVKMFSEGVIVTMPLFGTSVVGVKVTNRFPPLCPVTRLPEREALVQSTERTIV